MTSIKHRPNLTHRLNSGILLDYPPQLDGGGLLQAPEFVRIIRAHGLHTTYARAVEWCAGFGAIGFELMGSGTCQHISFTDCFPLAIENCRATARSNGLEQVSAYLASSIHAIEPVLPWDLVVSNPPHVVNREQFIQGLVDYGQHASADELEDLDVALRLTLDEDWAIHREFFANIGSRLSDRAEIFLSETGTWTALERMAQAAGFAVVGWYPMSVQNLHMLHLVRA